MSAGNQKRLHAIIKGRVQGVGFRYFVADLARQFRLTGLVRNLRNGDVEVIAEGESGALEALEAHLHNGPAGAKVDSVHAVWLPHTGEFRTFTIAATK